jgi:hypothetical protein
MKTLQTVAKVGTINYPDGIAYAPGPRRIFVSDEHGNVDAAIDTKTNSLAASIPPGGGAGNTVYDSGSGHILVAVHEKNEVVAIDPATMQIILFIAAWRVSSGLQTFIRSPLSLVRGGCRILQDENRAGRSGGLVKGIGPILAKKLVARFGAEVLSSGSVSGSFWAKVLIGNYVLDACGSLRLVPPSHTWPPATNVPAILFVVCPEFLAQSRLFIKDHEQMHTEGNCCDGSDQSRVAVPENHPQPDPARCKAHVHGVPHVAVETHHY